MAITLIIFGIFIVFVIIGFVKMYKMHSLVITDIDFANEYRKKFVDFANKYFKNYDQWSHSGNLDNELYVWLTMNVNKIQNKLGIMGEITYKPAFQNYMIPNYAIIINTIPKFREGRIESFDVSAVDDCFLRYIGHQEEYRKGVLSRLKNPFVWFIEGFREIFSIPLFILNWFGIFNLRTVNIIKESLVYKAIVGLSALVTLISGLVTIILGYDQTIVFINRFLEK